MSATPMIRRLLAAALLVQIGIGVLLVIGDIGGSAITLPRFEPSAPDLTQPIRPGDQRRIFDPNRPLPMSPDIRLPERLTLTWIEGGRYTLEGTIAPTDAQRIMDQLETLEPAAETLFLQSPGGSVREALSLGRALRARELATALQPGAICYSACPYLLAGGVTRSISDEASVGVHQHYFDQSTLLPAAFAVEDIQRGQADVMIYLDEMGIDTRVMQHALATPPDEIYVLLPEELERYRFPTPE